MTHLWKESERQNIGTPSIWLWGKYVAPVVQDLIDTMDMFRSQTAAPALKAFGCMIAMAIKTFFMAWREALGHARVQYHQNLRDAAPISMEIPKTPRGLSIESAVNLRKIQGAIGENWAAASSPPVRTYQGKASRWSDAKRVDAGKVMENPWQDSLASKAVASQAPAAHEEIRGLDDIFDRPVTGLFLDTDETAPLRKPRRKAGASPHRSLADYQYELPSETKTEAMKLETAANACECSRAKPFAHNYKATQSHAKAIPVHAGDTTPVHCMEGSSDWYSMTEGEAYQLDTGTVSPIEEYEPCFDDFEPIIAGGGDMPSCVPEPSRELPMPVNSQTSSPPIEASGSIDSQPPVNQKSVLNVEVPEPPKKAIPWFAQEADAEEKPPVANSTERKASNLIPWFLQECQKQISKVELPKAAPKAEVLESPAPVVQPQASVQPGPDAPLNLDHELEDDLNSISYMAQNNRMLSNSISNLVDSYFKQAAQEEEPNFY